MRLDQRECLHENQRQGGDAHCVRLRAAAHVRASELREEQAQLEEELRRLRRKAAR